MKHSKVVCVPVSLQLHSTPATAIKHLTDYKKAVQAGLPHFIQKMTSYQLFSFVWSEPMHLNHSILSCSNLERYTLVFSTKCPIVIGPFRTEQPSSIASIAL